MPEINLLYEVVRLLATLGCAAIGSLVLWKVYGPRIIKKFGSDRIIGWLKALGDDPESEDNVALQKAAGVQVAYMMANVLQDLQTPDGRQKYHPFAKALHSVVQASICGTWGNIVRTMQEEGHDITGGDPLSSFNNMPPMLTGMVQKAFPGVDLEQTVGVLKWLGSQSGRGNGDKAGGFASPSGSEARPGTSHRGVTQ